VREIEKGYAQRIEGMLAKVLGPGRVVARVTAELDFSSNEREEESYDPGSRVIRSERSIEEGSGQGQRGGIPGVVSNLSNDANTQANEQVTDQNSRRENVKNFEISRAITRSAQARGKLVRLSTAVIVDGKYIDSPILDTEGKSTGQMQKEYQALSPEMLSQVEGIVKSAVGFDGGRGDVVTVENVPFFAPDQSLQAELEKAAQTDQYLKYGGLMVPIVTLLLFVLFVLRPLVKFLTTTTTQEYDLSKLLPGQMLNADQRSAAESSASAGVLPDGGLPEGGAEGAVAKKGGITGLESSIDLEQFEEVVAENVKLVKENPQQAALLIRYWLNDGQI
jgi:flagellar M-ring protein FliF